MNEKSEIIRTPYGTLSHPMGEGRGEGKSTEYYFNRTHNHTCCLSLAL